MNPYFEKDDIVLLHGECLSQLSELPNNFVETIITDPPYGLSKEPNMVEVLTHWLAGDDYEHRGGGFMGKSWDSFIPGPIIWKECFRVLKPGGTLMCFAGTRTQDLMSLSIRLAGFSMRDVIMWLYGSGFPKATDISKQLQKKSGKEPIITGQAKHGACNIPNGNTFSDDSYEWKRHFDITQPTDEQAILWNGWKSHGLKPAYEPILVAMKPNDGTYANNALVHGVSGLNIAGGMIAYKSEVDKASATPQGKCTSKEVAAIGAEPDAGRDLDRVDFNRPKQKGRFPANIILDEEAGRMLDEQSGVSKLSVGKNVTRQKRNSSGVFDDKNCGLQDGSTEVEGFSDSGGASRFFYCAKASKKERNAGCEGLQEKRGSDEYRPNDDGSSGLQSRLHGATKKGTNHHPTVKPLALMEYLCTLTKTPTGGIILDPFMGSGTTGIAAKKIGRPFIGIERDEEYCEIAKARIIHATGDER